MLSSAIYDIEQGKYSQYGAYLHERHFIATLLLALVLHLGGFGIYKLLPKTEVQEIPVRVLNVKLGNVNIPPPPSSNNSFNKAMSEFAAKIKNAESIPLKEVELVYKRSNTTTNNKNTHKNKLPHYQPTPKKQSHAYNKSKAAKKYYRAMQHPQINTADDKSLKPGSNDGNANTNSAAIKSRYTQTLSLWIDKHKIYPQEARAKGHGGKVLLRIRINRQGRITRYYLEKSSGHESIDQAIRFMVDAANPVPPVPDDYPDKSPYLDFIIPINFKP